MIRNWSGLIILWLGIMMCLVYGYWSYPELWAACGVAALGSACFFTDRRSIGLALLLAGLVTAQFNVLIFFPINVSFWFGSFRINMLLIAVMVLLIYTNPDIMRRVTGQREVLTEEDRQEELDLKSRKFQARFRKMSTAKLEKIVSDRTLVPAAVRAAEVVLAAREEVVRE